MKISNSYTPEELYLLDNAELPSSGKQSVRLRKNNKQLEIIVNKLKLMCPRCYSLYETEVCIYKSISINSESKYIIVGNHSEYTYNGMCINCKSPVQYIPVDYNIGDIISILNKKGYRTKFCCEGHRLDDCGYILFEDTKYNKNILEYAKMLPEEFFIDIKEYKGHVNNIVKDEDEYAIITKENRYIIRWEFLNVYNPKYIFNTLKDWVDALPCIHDV